MHNTVTVGLGLGDEGKGTTIDYLCNRDQTNVVVRYNGGPQAGHHVVLADGRKHCFSQFGSGTFSPDVLTHLSAQMSVKIYDLVDEETELSQCGIADSFDRLTIDPNCLMVMPYHALIGRMREAARDNGRHGTTGKGVGEAVEEWRQNGDEVLTVKDLHNPSAFRKKAIRLWQEHCALGRQLIEDTALPEVEWVYQTFIEYVDTVEMVERPLRFASQHPDCFMSDAEFFALHHHKLALEGAQGTMLHEHLGFVPHITKSNTLAASGLQLLKNNGIDSESTVIGILRAYTTRHGFGPFVTEDAELTSKLPEPYHENNVWSGDFRCGWLDLVMARYAIEINGNIDQLAVTCLDRLAGLPRSRICTAYQYRGSNFDELDEFFDWCKQNGHAVIYRIKPTTNVSYDRMIARTELIKQFTPYEYQDFWTWNNPVTESDTLPQELLRYIHFIQRFLGIPISILSLGPTAADKRLL